VTADASLEAAYRRHWGRLLALLVGQYRRLDLAEDALSDAFESAARHWPAGGVPANPPAWLLTAARRRAVDRLRAEAVAVRKEPLLVVDAEHTAAAARVMADGGGVVEDDLLRLVLLCAHPSLAPESASALSLRLVVGVSTRDLARLFLVPEPTMAARLTRARKRLAAEGADFGIPSPADLPDRLAVVGQVAYLAFTAGYAPGSGPDLLRADLAGEAVQLAGVVHDLLPDQPLPTALLALMLMQHSRRDARIGADGRLVLLPDQDRTRWRTDEIATALDLLAPLVGADLQGEARSYLLQALIAAEHATATRAEDTDWARIAALYAELDTHTGSPVVRLNRAVAVAEASGPAAGLSLLEDLDAALPDGHRLPAVRAELLLRAGRAGEATREFDVAISRCANDVERAHLERRRADLG
jgi:RNA polymerase sigma-70 factor (ECF subfamily)